LTIGGGFGKISKLAMGHLDLHSGRSQVDLNWLAGRVAALGGDKALTAAVRGANTANQVLELARQNDLPLGDAIAALAREAALGVLDGETRIEVLIVNRQGDFVGRADG
ncbi:MAG: cobalt-precorrin-5B (C(1))-methyltransferase, partial [Kiloniellales bacterium]